MPALQINSLQGQTVTTMKFLIFLSLLALAIGQSSTSGGTSMSSMSSMSMSTNMAAPNASTAEYTITALPAVTGQPSCIFNCLIPIGLADPSGCDDVTNECACLSAPNDVLDVLNGCIQTVCKSSTSAYAAIATGLYESYCESVFGAAQFSQAFSSESAAAAASATASASASKSATASATGTSESMMWTPSL
jgi:hypothetical protein